MKTVLRRKVHLSAIGLVVMLLLAGCASSPAEKPEQSPASAAPGPNSGQESSTIPSPQPGSKGDGVTAPAPRPISETGYFTHKVRWHGESVSIIAGWYTGDLQNWKVLKEHNPGLNPNRIHEGNKIRIPEYLMKTKAPLPKEYVDSFYGKQTRKGPRPTPSDRSTGDEEETQLFGPK